MVEREVGTQPLNPSPTPGNSSMSSPTPADSGGALWTPMDSMKLEVAISLSLLVGIIQVCFRSVVIKKTLFSRRTYLYSAAQ